MGNLFWSLSTDPEKQAASQANLITAYFNLCGENLVAPEEPKQEPIGIPVDTDMNEEELDKFMRQKPKPRKVRHKAFPSSDRTNRPPVAAVCFCTGRRPV